MTRVVILGTKPNAIIPDADIVYCANAAIGFYRDEITKIKRTVSIASVLVLNKHFINKRNIDVDLYHDKWSAVISSSPEKLVLIDPPGHLNTTLRVTKGLAQAAYTAPIEMLGFKKRKELVRTSSNLPYPVLTRAVLEQPLNEIIDDFKGILKFYIRRKNEDVKAKFRPSTGIIALLYSIDAHGPQAKYIIAGIGIKDRKFHQQNKKMKQSEKNNKVGILAQHVSADIAILRSLVQRYDISTTEKELSNLLSIPNYQAE